MPARFGSSTAVAPQDGELIAPVAMLKDAPLSAKLRAPSYSENPGGAAAILPDSAMARELKLFSIFL